MINDALIITVLGMLVVFTVLGINFFLILIIGRFARSDDTVVSNGAVLSSVASDGARGLSKNIVAAVSAAVEKYEADDD